MELDVCTCACVCTRVASLQEGDAACLQPEVHCYAAAGRHEGGYGLLSIFTPTAFAEVEQAAAIG